MKACYNLCVVQILVRLTCGLSRKERRRLEEDYRREPLAKSLSAYLGYAVGVMESATLYKDVDADAAPSGVGEADHIDGLDISDLEASAQELALPFLRIAALMRHYIFEQELPAVAEDAAEFAALVDFLELTSRQDEGGVEAMETEAGEHAVSRVSSVVDGINWFRPDPTVKGSNGQPEMDLWLMEFVPLVQRKCAKAKQLLQVNLLWRQPVLLKVPKNYDDIFQVGKYICLDRGSNCKL